MLLPAFFSKGFHTKAIESKFNSSVSGFSSIVSFKNSLVESMFIKIYSFLFAVNIVVSCLVGIILSVISSFSVGFCCLPLITK